MDVPGAAMILVPCTVFSTSRHWKVIDKGCGMNGTRSRGVMVLCSVTLTQDYTTTAFVVNLEAQKILQSESDVLQRSHNLPRDAARDITSSTCLIRFHID